MSIFCCFSHNFDHLLLNREYVEQPCYSNMNKDKMYLCMQYAPTHTYNIPGIYTAVVTATDGISIVTATTPVTITGRVN